MNSASVTIDAGVLGVPRSDGTADDAHNYVETILDWATLLDEPWVAIYMSERASETLDGEKLFPMHDQLRRLFKANSITEYSINDVARVVNDLLQRTPHFETFFRISDVLAEEFTTEPDVLRLCAGSQLKSDLARCIVLIAIIRQHCETPISDHLLILRRTPNRTIKVRAMIHDLEHNREDLSAMPNPPDYFEGEVLTCDDFRGLIDCLDEANILLTATGEVGIETAVRIAVYRRKLASDGDADWDDPPRFVIGRKFLASFNNCHPTKQVSHSVLQSIVDTLEGKNMRRTHALRTGTSGGDPQRVRKGDQATAWRRDIDREHHFHYWVCEQGLVELASISFPHDDFMIPE